MINMFAGFGVSAGDVDDIAPINAIDGILFGIVVFLEKSKLEFTESTYSFWIVMNNSNFNYCGVIIIPSFTLLESIEPFSIGVAFSMLAMVFR